MILSICMIVKDEEKNMKRCLESLVPLMEAIPSELIIVDTGSTDKTVDIAKKYTEKVYFHKWNNNFSDMRNISINYAKGQWIFIIDADEELVDCSKLVSFFRCKDRNKMNTINIYVNNVLDTEREDKILLISSPRFFKNDGRFMYKGSVHNEAVYFEPVVNIDAVLNHYGYISNDKELMEKKFLRTKALLENELEKDPENIYYIFQLSVSYNMHKDLKKSLQLIEKAYNLLLEKNLDKKIYKYIYGEVVYNYLNFNKFKDIIRVCKEGLEVEEEYIDLWYGIGVAQFKTDRYEEAIVSLEKYLWLVDNFEKLAIRSDNSIKNASLKYTELVYNILSKSYFKTGDFDKALNCVKKLKNKDAIKESIQIMNITANSNEDFEKIASYYNEFLLHNDEELVKLFQKYFEMKKNSIKEEEKQIDLVKLFSKNEDIYSNLNKIRIAYYEKSENLYNMCIEFMDTNKFEELPDFYGDIIYYLMTLQESLTDIMYFMHEVNLYKFLNYLYGRYSNLGEIIYEYLISNIEESSFKLVKINKILSELASKVEKIPEDVFESVFKMYIQSGIKYITTIYNKEAVDNGYVDIETLSPSDAFLVSVYWAEEKKQNKKEHKNLLKFAATFYPDMIKGVEMVIDEIENTKEKVIINPEMERLKLQLKEKIKNLIAVECMEDAKQLINEYEQIVPGDLEIILFKSQIATQELKINSNNYDSSLKM